MLTPTLTQDREIFVSYFGKIESKKMDLVKSMSAGEIMYEGSRLVKRSSNANGDLSTSYDWLKQEFFKS